MNPLPISGRDAVFSPCRRYRYALWRWWGGSDRHAMFIGLNPSTADEIHDDPTVRRCIAYARAWGFGGMWMTNLFGWRATDPADLKRVDEPNGADNDWTLRRLARHADLVVAAWGLHGAHRDRGLEVLRLLPRLHCLRLTQQGFPAHPLYLPARLQPLPWTPVAEFEPPCPPLP